MNLKDNLLFGMKHTITDEQMNLLNTILSPVSTTQVIFIDALAGTGKTQISVMGAKLREKPLRYIFAPVQEETQGYLPGDIVEKSMPYTAPLKQALRKINEDESAIFDSRLNKFMNAKAWVYAEPHTFERGVNYEDETVIIDEAQNFTTHQLRKIITRCSDNCKLIIIGNMKQCDLEDPRESGFEGYMYHGQYKEWIKKLPLTQNFRGRIAQWGDEL